MSENQTFIQEELLMLQNSSEEAHKDNSTLITRKQIPNTPFTVVGNETVGYFVSWGHYRITEHKDTIEEATNLIDTDTWNIITRLMGAIFHYEKNNE